MHYPLRERPPLMRAPALARQTGNDTSCPVPPGYQDMERPEAPGYAPEQVAATWPQKKDGLRPHQAISTTAQQDDEARRSPCSAKAPSCSITYIRVLHLSTRDVLCCVEPAAGRKISAACCRRRRPAPHRGCTGPAAPASRSLFGSGRAWSGANAERSAAQRVPGRMVNRTSTRRWLQKVQWH
jgi:hypothetical protein